VTDTCHRFECADAVADSLASLGKFDFVHSRLIGGGVSKGLRAFGMELRILTLQLSSQDSWIPALLEENCKHPKIWRIIFLQYVHRFSTAQPPLKNTFDFS